MDKTVLISGASGLVATQLTLDLLDSGVTKLYLISRNPRQLAKRYARYADVECLSYSKLFSGSITVNPDVCVHAAFARTQDESSLTESVELTRRIGQYIYTATSAGLIYLSSQGVYGDSYKMNACENAELNPADLYSKAKLEGENVLTNIFAESTERLCLMRLASICEKPRFITTFVRNCIRGLPLRVLDSGRKVSFIDVRDVVRYIKSMMELTAESGGVCNIGTGQCHSIPEIARMVATMAARKYNLPEVQIQLNKTDGDGSACMSSEKLQILTGLQPEYSIESMVESIFELLLFPGTGNFPKAFNYIYNPK